MDNGWMSRKLGIMLIHGDEYQLLGFLKDKRHCAK